MVLLAMGLVVPTAQQPRLPGRFEAYATDILRLTADERRTLFAGGALTRLLEGDPSREVGVFGAVWVSAPIGRYVTALSDIERFESGSAFRVTKRISDPARVEDFAALALTDEDVRDLETCKVGDCELKLGTEALARLRANVNWTRSDRKQQVEAVVRQIAVDYVTAYREGGNRRLAVYRDREAPTFVEEEFRLLIERAPELTGYMPALREFLLAYPRPPSAPTDDFFYWQDVSFGLKPTLRINHVGIQQSAEGALVASKLLYSSHYFWTALELRALVPDPARGDGFWLATINRSRSDGLSGFTGRIIRGRVREEARKGLEQGLTATKARLEAK
jgi:hypothetical protein